MNESVQLELAKALAQLVAGAGMVVVAYLKVKYDIRVISEKTDRGVEGIGQRAEEIRRTLNGRLDEFKKATAEASMLLLRESVRAATSEARMQAEKVFAGQLREQKLAHEAEIAEFKKRILAMEERRCHFDEGEDNGQSKDKVKGQSDERGER